MPGRDQSGPQGMGPMTGHGGGYCRGAGMPDDHYKGFGPGFGAVQGRRRCFRRSRGYSGRFSGFAGRKRFGGGDSGLAARTPETEQQYWHGQAEFLERRLEDIQARLKAMQASDDASQG